MSLALIESRLQGYSIQSKQDELNAIKEIIQEIALAALSRTEFFKYAMFQGGTCLRIVYALPRFSEDLDFILTEANPNFVWKPYLENMKIEFESYGLSLEVEDRSKVNSSVKKAFIKEDSFGKILTLSYKTTASDMQKIQIKFEIDTNPPLGSLVETKYLDFPFPFSVVLQDMPSLFASKCHAILCRKYTKGRDWFDFIWYVSRKTSLNYEFFKNAINQMGNWSGEKINVNKNWVLEQLENKIEEIDWEMAKQDVIRFLRPREAESLKIWGKPLFLSTIEKLEGYL